VLRSSLASGQAGLQALVFGLATAAITSVYLTQPVLPQLSQEFGASPAMASLTVSMVILGTTLACMPFGVLADRWPLKPIIGLGGGVIALSLLAGALSQSLPLLVAARFVQGLFIPALTSCLAAYLSRTLPPDKLAVVMGSYVSATVVGGLSSRLLSGLLLEGHWRLSLLVVAGLIVLLCLAALRWLPAESRPSAPGGQALGYLGLLRRRATLVPYLSTFGSMFVFGAVFNYVPYYLAAAPFQASTAFISLVYLTYLVGVILGPLVGRLTKRVGSGWTLTMGALLFMAALLLSLAPSLTVVVLALLAVCGGHFIIHAASQGILNVRLKDSQGRGNSLYVLVYYLGGWAGITAAGPAWSFLGWPGVAALCLAVLLLPLLVGVAEIRRRP
jgi:MFS transporter, YNFM family, putative membrane transport protein